MLKLQQSIDTMLAANAKPQSTKGGSVILKSGNKRHTLLSSQGERTALGEYYDPTQAPFREGNTEFIKMRNGEESAVRRYDPAENEYKFTKLGKSFIPVSRETTSCKSLLW